MLAQLANRSALGVTSFRSADAALIHSTLSSQLSQHSFDYSTRQRLDARVYSAKIGAITLFDLRYGSDVVVRAEIGLDDVLVHIALEGSTSMMSGGDRVWLDEGTIYVTSPGETLQVEMTSQCRHLAVRIPSATCVSYLRQELLLPAHRPLKFWHTSKDVRSLSIGWRNLMEHLAGQVSASPDLLANARLARQYELLATEMLLSNYSNSYSSQVALHANAISPRHVKKARDLIHERLDQHISVAVLAAQTGVSARTLQNGFQNFLGVSPTEYIRQQRLEKLHAMLSLPAEKASVGELMSRCGIVNFSRYAHYYREIYRCLPSQTLRRNN